jgi:hypothetical protein
MGMFVSGRVAITASGITDEKDLTPETDVIFILPKMTFGVRNKVVGDAAKLIQKTGQSRRERRKGKAKGEKEQVEFNVGAYQTALLVHNVLAWHGPSFTGFACTPENIAALDPDQPLVKIVVDAISDRNTPAEEDTPELDDPNVIELTATTTAT